MDLIERPKHVVGDIAQILFQVHPSPLIRTQRPGQRQRTPRTRIRSEASRLDCRPVSNQPDVSWRRMALLVAAVLLVVSACAQTSFAQGGVDVRIATGEPFTWDPALAGDSGSANVIAQVFEGLTAFDLNNKVQPALADSWQTSDDGRQITFHLRSGNTFSDGSPITAQDVVDSWLRTIDPARPSPLYSLLAD